MKYISKIQEFISVRYIYSACIITATPDLVILHDPWFTEGIYDGSWYHFPKVENPINSIGNVDAIYISHIHPDHYDKHFLKSYFKQFGEKIILISNHNPNHLKNKMLVDGFKPTVVDKPFVIGKTSIEIIPHKTGSDSDIDSAIIIKLSTAENGQQCVVNANDVIFDDKMIKDLKSAAGEVDILLCGYTGAGPYPQTYFSIDDPQLLIEANKKKNNFFQRYLKLTESIGAKVNIPFAGKYVLGGRLACLNPYRGVSDPVEILKFDKKAVVLSDNGGSINTFSLEPSSSRTSCYDGESVKLRISEISNSPMLYEQLIPESEIYQLPLKRLLNTAVKNATYKSECVSDYFFVISLPNDERALINANKYSATPFSIIKINEVLPSPRSEIFIDPRYLFGLLTNVYHWNNAEVGSQYLVRRTPNELNRRAQTFLNYLCI
jgi:UDP-MurNAc hydroxylase